MTTVRQQLYTPYERVWHWLQALMILSLLYTGWCIHAPSSWLAVISFPLAVRIHNVLGFLLLANAFLGGFYYLTTGTIRQFLPQPRDFLELAARQALYYLRGMFRGEPHPLEKTTARRLNPLQQVTYLGILNVLLPLQAITGLLMWGGQHWPQSVSGVGGLPVLGAVHTLGAWLFAAFVLAHIYLTTTGQTPWSNIRAMITGYEDLPAAHRPAETGNS